MGYGLVCNKNKRYCIVAPLHFLKTSSISLILLLCGASFQNCFRSYTGCFKKMYDFFLKFISLVIQVTLELRTQRCFRNSGHS